MTSKEQTAMNEHANWLVYSREHNAWWRTNAAGYTNDIAQAGRYAEAGAKFHCNARDKQPDGSPSEVAVIAPEFQARADAAERLLADARGFIQGEYEALLECSCPHVDGEPDRARCDSYALKNVEAFETILGKLDGALE